MLNKKSQSWQLSNFLSVSFGWITIMHASLNTTVTDKMLFLQLIPAFFSYDCIWNRSAEFESWKKWMIFWQCRVVWDTACCCQELLWTNWRCKLHISFKHHLLTCTCGKREYACLFNWFPNFVFLLVLHIAAAPAAAAAAGVVVVVVVASVLDTFPPQTSGNQPNHQIRLSIAKKAPWIFLGWSNWSRDSQTTEILQLSIHPFSSQMGCKRWEIVSRNLG